MKVLLLLIAVGVLFWLLRASLRRVRPPQADKPAPPTEPKAMLQCAHCGLHLPRDEALPGQGGVFCGEPHRSAFEAAHRDS